MKKKCWLVMTMAFMTGFAIVGCQQNIPEDPSIVHAVEGTNNLGKTIENEKSKEEVVAKDSKFVTEEVYKKASIEILNLKYSKEIKDSIYDMEFQDSIRQELDYLIQTKDYTIEKPLIAINPFGTNTNSLYVAFETEQACEVEYTIHVEDDKIADYTQTLKNDAVNNMATKHEYQLIGFIPSTENTVQLRLKDASGKVIKEQSFTYETGVNVKEEQIHLEVKDGKSKQPLENGLFALLGHDKTYNANIYLYDNDGVLRSEIPLIAYRSDRILFVDDLMLYSYGYKKIAGVNRVGKVEKLFYFPEYKLHHDFIYDEKNNQILILANQVGADTIEDKVVAIDFETGKSKLVVDFKKLMPDVYADGVQPEGGNTYGGNELDWIHFNSLDLFEEGSIVLSSRETSTIFRVDNIYTEPKIKYMIADSSLWEKYPNYQKILYKKASEFEAQSGQHAVQVKYDESLPEGQYYLFMYNNNFATARTRPFLDWSAFPSAGTYQKGTNSYYYQYLVDEKAKTFDLVKKIKLPYSSIVSSVQDFGNNIVTSSGMSHCYNEYDKDGVLIRQYNYDAEKYAYRALKYNFINYWYK